MPPTICTCSREQCPEQSSCGPSRRTSTTVSDHGMNASTFAARVIVCYTVGLRLRCGRGDRGAKGAVARWRTRTCAGCGVRDRGREQGRGVPAGEARARRAAHGFRAQDLPRTRPEGGRTRRRRRAPLHHRRGQGTLRAGARCRADSAYGFSRSTSPAGTCRPTSSSTRRYCCTGSGCPRSSSPRPSRRGGWRGGRRIASSSGRSTASSGRSPCTWGAGMEVGCRSESGSVGRYEKRPPENSGGRTLLSVTQVSRLSARPPTLHGRRIK